MPARSLYDSDSDSEFDLNEWLHRPRWKRCWTRIKDFFQLVGRKIKKLLTCCRCCSPESRMVLQEGGHYNHASVNYEFNNPAYGDPSYKLYQDPWSVSTSPDERFFFDNSLDMLH